MAVLIRQTAKEKLSRPPCLIEALSELCRDPYANRRLMLIRRSSGEEFTVLTAVPNHGKWEVTLRDGNGFKFTSRVSERENRFYDHFWRT